MNLHGNRVRLCQDISESRQSTHTKAVSKNIEHGKILFPSFHARPYTDFVPWDWKSNHRYRMEKFCFQVSTPVLTQILYHDIGKVITGIVRHWMPARESCLTPRKTAVFLFIIKWMCSTTLKRNLNGHLQKCMFRMASSGNQNIGNDIGQSWWCWSGIVQSQSLPKASIWTIFWPSFPPLVVTKADTRIQTLIQVRVKIISKISIKIENWLFAS